MSHAAQMNELFAAFQARGPKALACSLLGELETVAPLFARRDTEWADYMLDRTRDWLKERASDNDLGRVRQEWLRNESFDTGGGKKVDRAFAHYRRACANLSLADHNRDIAAIVCSDLGLAAMLCYPSGNIEEAQRAQYASLRERLDGEGSTAHSIEFGTRSRNSLLAS